MILIGGLDCEEFEVRVSGVVLIMVKGLEKDVQRNGYIFVESAYFLEYFRPRMHNYFC